MKVEIFWYLLQKFQSSSSTAQTQPPLFLIHCGQKHNFVAIYNLQAPCMGLCAFSEKNYKKKKNKQIMAFLLLFRYDICTFFIFYFG